MSTPTDAQQLPDAKLPTRGRKRLRRSTPELQERRRKTWRYLFVLACVVLMVNALFGERGYLANLQARQEQYRLEAVLHALRVKNAELSETAKRIKHDPQALEDAARRDLGLIRPGETLITIRDRTKD